MKKLLFSVFLLLSFLRAQGQIYMNDSTVHVIGYWDNMEKQTYTMTHEKLVIRDNETISREFYKYAIDITIVDSTENSYTIDWFYHDYEVQSDNEITKLLFSIAEDMTCTIKTDELGEFKEVVNWEEMRDYILKGTNLIKQEMEHLPDFDKLVTQIENMYSTKESIETVVMHEIQQFYTFHGGAYKLGEIYSADMKVPNGHGDEPFDAEITVWLDEIDPDDNNYILRLKQEVNQQQLVKSTFDYLSKLAEAIGAVGPTLDEIPTLQNEIWIASRIHGSGWVIYSVKTKEITVEGQTNIEETIIEIQ